MERDSKRGQRSVSHSVCYNDFHKNFTRSLWKPNKGHETVTVFQNAIIIQEKFERGKKEFFIFIKFIFYSEDKNTQTQKVEAKKKNLFQNINRKRSKIKTIHQILKFAFTKETAFC